MFRARTTMPLVRLPRCQFRLSVNRYQVQVSRRQKSTSQDPVNGSLEKTNRSLFYVPGSSQKMIDKAWTLEPDNITLDLEDSVSTSEKNAARKRVVDALGSHPTAQVAVRINSDGYNPDLEDLKALVPVSHAIDAIVLPKFSAAALTNLSKFVTKNFKRPQVQKRIDVSYYILAESPRTIANLSYHLSKVNRRKTQLRGVIFGAEDYAQEVGITRTPSLIEMTYARQKVVTVAKAYNLEALDLVSTNFRDMDVLRSECEQGASFGFTGKQVIHPAQIPIVHEAFSPSKDAIEHAARLLTKFVEEASEGKRGSWEFEGKMVDKPVITKAKKVLTLASNLNVEKDTAAPVLERVRQLEENLGESLNETSAEEKSS